MDIKHTFNLEELREFLEVKCLKSKDFDDEFEYINELFKESLCWDRKLSSLNHIFSILLEQFEKKGGINNLKIIHFIYELENECNFNIQAGGMHFLEKLFMNNASPNLSLEEELIEIENQLH